jgi:hypothetical protein
MKKLTFLLSFLFLGFIAVNTQAQIKLPKSVDVNKMNQSLPDGDFTKDILKALSPDKSLGLSPDKLLKLTDNNKSFVDKALGVLNGSGSEEEKNNKLGVLQNDRKDFIEKLLGESKASEYYGLVKKQVQPLVTKYAMAKFFM